MKKEKVDQAATIVKRRLASVEGRAGQWAPRVTPWDPRTRSRFASPGALHRGKEDAGPEKPKDPPRQVLGRNKTQSTVKFCNQMIF
jgi:hypothetical protein